jgi:hypothetical protein
VKAGFSTDNRKVKKEGALVLEAHRQQRASSSEVGYAVWLSSSDVAGLQLPCGGVGSWWKTSFSSGTPVERKKAEHLGVGCSSAARRDSGKEKEGSKVKVPWDRRIEVLMDRKGRHRGG